MLRDALVRAPQHEVGGVATSLTYPIARSASPASHGFHHNFSPRSRAMMPALIWRIFDEVSRRPEAVVEEVL